MRLEQWMETTSDWKENLCVMDDPKRWKGDFREKIIRRLDAVLHQTYPESNHWTLRNLEDGLCLGNKELFWGDLADCEIHFLDLLFELLPRRKELEVAKKDRWEIIPIDKRKQLVDAIICLQKIEKWTLDDESMELIQMRILHPRLYRILRNILELSDMNWSALYEANFKDSDLLEVEENLKTVKKILSSYEPADTNIIESQAQFDALIDRVIEDRSLKKHDSSEQ